MWADINMEFYFQWDMRCFFHEMCFSSCMYVSVCGALDREILDIREKYTAIITKQIVMKKKLHWKCVGTMNDARNKFYRI